jgi:hypothetical protein
MIFLTLIMILIVILIYFFYYYDFVVVIIRNVGPRRAHGEFTYVYISLHFLAVCPVKMS